MNQDIVPRALNVSQRLTWRMMFVIVAMVIVSDLTLYQSEGFFGPTVFFPAACGLLVCGSSQCKRTWPLLTIGLMIVILAIRLAWSGTVAQIAIGLWLLNAFAMTTHGLSPFLLESIVYLASAIPGGYELLQSVQVRWRQTVLDSVDQRNPSRLMNIMLPLISVFLFGTLFLLANPDLISRVSAALGEVFTRVQSWIMKFSFGEIVFWCMTAWLTAGFLNPLKWRSRESPDDAGTSAETTSGAIQQASKWHRSDDAALSFDKPAVIQEGEGMFIPFRNTLVSLIVLFATYLLFEFGTLWFRQFPAGFHYSGYAHQGAAWLTAALALATVVLSLMFRGELLQHPKISRLRQAAWCWSLLNFLLAASVYNRLMIYIDFNGMTRMRVVGLLGTTAVAGGLALVIWKIAKSQSFHWLIRHQMLLPAFAVFLYVTLPVDVIVHRFNVQRILDGHPEPSVQISEHPMEDSALPVLIPLLESKNQIIRNGVHAILTARLSELQTQRSNIKGLHWTARQLGEDYAVRALEGVLEKSSRQPAAINSSSARQAFHDYAMQWW